VAFVVLFIVCASMMPSTKVQSDVSGLEGLAVIVLPFIIWRPSLIGGAIGATIAAVASPATGRIRALRAAAGAALVAVTAFLLSTSPATLTEDRKPPWNATELMVAVVRRDLGRVKELIAAGADVNATIDNRSALAFAFDLHAIEDPHLRLNAALLTGNLGYLSRPDSTRWQIARTLREHGALAMDGASRSVSHSGSPWPPTGAIGLTRLEVRPQKAGFHEPIVVEFEVANTGRNEAHLAPDPRFEPPDALLGWAEFSFCGRSPLYPTACLDFGKAAPRVWESRP